MVRKSVRLLHIPVAAVLTVVSLVMFCMLVSTTNGAAQPTVRNSLDEVLPFDIASQPLEDALYEFGRVSGIEVVTDGEIVKGRKSTAVRGAFSAARALTILLAGTGLLPRTEGGAAVTLAIDPDGPSRAAAQHRYAAALQAAALQQLCREGSPLALGTYRIAMSLWVDSAGGISRIDFLGSTGNRLRDERIRSLLKGKEVGKPPALLRQPIVMVILPRLPGESGDCRTGAGGAALGPSAR